MIKVKATVTFKEYLRLLLGLAYRKPVMKVILLVALIMLTWILGYYTHILVLPKPAFYQFATLALICVVQPIVIISTIWKSYHSSNHLKEPSEMEFTSKELRIKGASFATQLIWEKMYKLEEVKNWFLAYQNSLSAILIPKKSFTAQKDKEFRQLLQSVSGIQVYLKDDKANKDQQ